MNSRLTIRILPGAILLALLTASPLLASQRGNQKVIKDPAEYAAYMSAIKTREPVAKAAALETFINTYPDSVVKIDALEHAMSAYQQSGNQVQVQKTAQRILALAPYNVRALAVLTYLERNSTDQNVPDFCGNAQRGLQAIAGWQSPGEMPEAEYHKLRGQMAEIFLGSLGFCSLQSKDYSTARDYYQKALQINANNLLNVYQLAVADLEMTPMDVTGFWYISKAINLAQEQGNTQSSNATEEYGKAKYRKYHGGDDGWDTLMSEAAKQSSPQKFQAVIGHREPTPADLAVTAVKQHDPATLSFSDWEFVLSFRDSSADNKDAADKVWHAIQDKQQGGKAKLKIPMKVIGVNSNTIQAAITEDNQAANKTDVQIVMQKPMAHLPVVGSKIEILGLITGYTPQPFMFTMGNAELFSPQPEVHTQLSESDIEELLQGGVSPKRATELVKQKGVDFALDDAAEARLRKAGATEELLLAIAKGKQ